MVVVVMMMMTVNDSNFLLESIFLIEVKLYFWKHFTFVLTVQPLEYILDEIRMCTKIERVH